MERYGEGLSRLRNEVGRKGKIYERLPVGDSVGGWAERIEAVNSLVDDLSQPTVEMGRVIGAVAKGDLTQAVPLEVAGRPLQGEYLRTAKLVKGAKLKVYKGAPHGMCSTRKNEINEDLLDFMQS